MIKLFLVLVMGHLLGDFGLQSLDMIKYKNPFAKTKDRHPTISWFYWLWSHGAIHGLIVYTILRSTGLDDLSCVILACLEWYSHFWIDYGKLAKIYGVHVDQCLHLVCQLYWAFWAARWVS